MVSRQRSDNMKNAIFSPVTLPIAHSPLLSFHHCYLLHRATQKDEDEFSEDQGESQFGDPLDIPDAEHLGHRGLCIKSWFTAIPFNQSK